MLHKYSFLSNISGLRVKWQPKKGKF
uniref:Uncharacterized protein n=1 Tax=Anguilla anguilla TaxID=7936 RepID=A0A0E9PQS1_ANGAN